MKKIKHDLMKIVSASVMLLIFAFTSCTSSDGGTTSAPTLNVTETQLSFVKDAQTQKFSVQSNVSWSISGAASWCSITPEYNNIGDANKVVTLDVAVTANDSYDSRSCTLTVTAGTLNKTIVVTQNNKDGVILDSTTVHAAPKGETLILKLKTTAPYIAIPSDSWMQQVSTRTLTDTTVTLNVDANYTKLSRIGTVVFKVGSATQTLTVIQDTASTSAIADYIVPDVTGMSSDATVLARQIEAGWNLGNTMEAYNSNVTSETLSSEWSWQSTKTTQKIIGYVKASGFNAVRIPCAWTHHLIDPATNTIDPAWLARVKEIVDYVVNDGMYAIINIHWDGGWLEVNGFTDTSESNVSAVENRQKILWKQIAKYFRGYDEHLMFAGLNEPGQDGVVSNYQNLSTVQCNALIRYEQAFVDAVRGTGGKNYYRNLIVQGPRTDIDNTYENYYTLPVDKVNNRMMVEVHFYSPYNFGLDTSTSSGFFYWGSDNHLSSSSHNSTWGEQSYIDTEFAKMRSKYTSKGIPVILGEYGANWRDISSISGESQSKHNSSIQLYYEYVTKQAKNNGMVPFVWDTNALSLPSMTIINRSGLSIFGTYALQGIKSGAAAGIYPF
jgi:endoglucanase